MVSQKVLIKNPTGLHLRPAGILCKEAMQYKSLITFRFGDDNTANAKSVLSVLGACIKCGDEIEFVCDGEDEDKALEAELLADEKELAEHNMLVDLGRNDLGKISKFGTVEVETLHSIERFSHVMHIGSTVRGEIDENHDDLERKEKPSGLIQYLVKYAAAL
jgi:phosphotransferase system HPr (HPr) family protein